MNIPIPAIITDSATRALSAGSTVLQASANEAGKLAAQYGPVAMDKAKTVMTEQVPKGLSKAAKWAAENPKKATYAVVGTTAAVAIVAPRVVAVPVLGAVGFGAEGVVAGTAAAAAQSAIGNVGAGSLFATMQSAGAGGAGLAIVNGVVQGAGALIAAGSAGIAWLKEGNGNATEESENADDETE